MGAGSSVRRETRIPASPDQVRRVLLDFAAWPEWNTSMIISVIEPKKKDPASDLRAGDALKSDLHGTIVYPVVVENSPEKLAWRASFHGIVVAHHSFEFRPDPDSHYLEGRPGTIFVDEESVSGLLSFMFRSGWSQRMALEGRADKFLDELVARVQVVTSLN
ncbi:hypothetical protein B0H66DRAFT_218223 [Apodospora peruviana]|uniref:Polyketide cyclase/dehydrase n=1 Tax=Apodospora peruviana TaxID=516989 RepID=A0AAE0M914_9PEZI|nr:hypothetical protein B0H66DRAFT_218223 [Apodospora peruviana]